MEKKSRKLINNTVLFFIGNLGSKFIQFFLVPLYTYTLSTTEYGVTDLVITTINFLIPIFSIQISDGLLRFGMDKNENQIDVINNSFKVLLIGSFFSVLLSPIFSFSDTLKEWIFYFLIIMNLRMYRDFFSIILKIQDKNKLFAVDSILYTFVLCICSVINLVILKMKISGYFLSYVIANIFSIIFIIITSRIRLSDFFIKMNKKLVKKIIIYTAPLIINSISYWITTAFDRYMINWMLDQRSVGLYAVASKIPTILTTFTGIFSQAWLISSISEYENDRDTNFYVSAFMNYCEISLIICAILILIIRPFMFFYVSNEYFVAWKYSPILILSAVFSGICSFLNGIYYAYKRNISTTVTTIVGATVNIVLNYIMIPKIGILGASIATLISWFIIMVLKLIYMKKFICFKVNYFYLLVSVILVLIEIIVLNLKNKLIIYSINFTITILIMYINRSIISKSFSILKNKMKGIKI